MTQSLLASHDPAKYVQATGAFGAMSAVRVEMGLRKFVNDPAGNQYLFSLDPYINVYIYGGSLDIDQFQIGYYDEAIGDALSWHETGYTNGNFPSDEFLLRFQFNSVLHQLSLEVWDYFGNRHAQKIIAIANVSWTFNFVRILNTLAATGGELDFLRIYNTNVAVGAAPPSRVLAGAPVHAWEFEGNLNDTGSGPAINAAWVGGGAPAYGTEPFAPTAPVVLDSLGYFTGTYPYIEVNYTNSNVGSLAPEFYDVERREGVSGDWRAIGFIAAPAATYTDKLVKHNTNYAYRVIARNRFGATATSNELAITSGAGADTNPVIAENAKPGTAAWGLTNPATAMEIEGYCDATSVNRGGTINLKVNSVGGQNFNLEVFRLGWYAGLGARRIRNVLAVAGTAQVIAAETGAYPNQLREQNWTTSHALSITDADPTEWQSGIYLVRLTRVVDGKQAYMVFCVRDDARQSKYLYNQPVNTYQAYNNWPNTSAVYSGRGLYGFASQGGNSTSQVSYNRPYGIQPRADGAYGIGAGDLLALLSVPTNPAHQAHTAANEINTLRWIEKEGYDVQYCTDVDLHSMQSELWRRCYTMLFPGHQEYWTRQMRETADAARDYGRHLAFLGANAAYWQVRMVPSAIGAVPNRNVFTMKTLGADPVGDAPTQTKTWRDLQGFNSSIEGEWKLIGVQYQGDPQLHETMVWSLAATDALSTAILAGTSLLPGDLIVGVIGYEWDRENDVGESHSGIKAGRYLLANSPLPPGGHPDPRSHMTLYKGYEGTKPWHHNGAVVWGVGTLQWAWALDDYGVAQGGRPLSYLHAGAQQLTRNILGLMSEATVATLGSGSAAPHFAAAMIGLTFTDADMAILDGGAVIEVRNGGMPALPSDPDVGTLGVTINLPTIATANFDLPVGTTFNPPSKHFAIASITPTYARLKVGGVVMSQWEIGPTKEMKVSQPALIIGQRVQLECLVWYDPTQAITPDTDIYGVLSVAGNMAGGVSELPRQEYLTPMYTPSGTVRRVGPGQTYANPDDAWNDADWDDIIEIEPGFTWTPPGGAGWNPAAKSPDVAPIHRYIFLRGRILPIDNEDNRATEANFVARACPKIYCDNAGSGFATTPGFSYARFIGIEFAPDPISTPAEVFSLVNVMANIGPGAQGNTAADIPHHIIFDRCLMHGSPTCHVIHALLMNGDYIALRKSTIDTVYNDFSDSTAISSWSSNGPLHIEDNRLRALTENILFGGAEPILPRICLADVKIYYNDIDKDPSWDVLFGRFKTLIELKIGRRVEIKGNHVWNNWEGNAGWGGACVTLKVTNQDWEETVGHITTCDVTIWHNDFHHVGIGLNFHPMPSNNAPATMAARLYVYNNLYHDLGASPADTAGTYSLLIAMDVNYRACWRDFSFIHNTGVSSRLFAMIYDNTGMVKFENYKIKDNINALGGDYPIGGDGAGYTDDNLAQFFDAASCEIDHNIFVCGITSLGGPPPAGAPTSPEAVNNEWLPFTNFLYPEIGFQNLALDNYKLADSSPWKLTASDGTDPGVDWDLLQTILAQGDIDPDPGGGGGDGEDPEGPNQRRRAARLRRRGRSAR